MEKNIDIPKNNKIEELPYDHNPNLGIYLTEIKCVSQRDICTPLFIEALFTIGKI